MVLVSRAKATKKKLQLPHKTSDLRPDNEARKGKKVTRLSLLKSLLGPSTALSRIGVVLMFLTNVYVYFLVPSPTECNEMSSFARWHHFTFPSNELLVDENIYIPPTSTKKRSERFPSVEERVKFYMGQWYEPALQGSPPSSPFGLHWEERYRSARHTHDPLVNPLEMDPELLHQCSVEYQEHARDDATLATTCAYHGNDYQVTVGKYARDTVGPAMLAKEFRQRNFLSHWWQVLKYEGIPGLLMELFKTPKLSRKAKPAYLFHYGPKVSEASTLWNTQTPVFGRVRNIVKANQTSLHSPIIWPMDRYFDLICQVPRRDTDLVHKEIGGNRLYWRGDADVGGSGLRRQWVEMFKGNVNPEIDVKHQTMGPTINRVLEHKYVLVLEGWDSPDELLWKMFGSSLIFMQKPTHVSWGMESLLKPYVHYVPVTKETADKQLKWAISHPEKVKEIREASTLWVWDMFFHPQAPKDEEEILRTIIHRYHQFILRAKPISK